MDTLKQNALVIVVSVLLALLGAWFLGVGGTNTQTVTREVVKEIQKGDTNIGAISSPDIMSQYLSVGGLRAWYYNYPLTTATTTVCAIPTPAATSTLDYLAVRFAVSSTTASRVTIAKAATAFATTTIIGSATDIAANAQDTIVASTTAAQKASEVDIIAPNQYIVVGMAGGGGNFSPSGVCTARFTELQ